MCMEGEEWMLIVVFDVCVWKGGSIIYLCCPTRDSWGLRDWVNAGTALRVEALREESARRVRVVVMSYSPHWRWPPGSVGRGRC